MVRASTDGAFDCCAAEQFVPDGAEPPASKPASTLALSNSLGSHQIAAMPTGTMQCYLLIMLLLLNTTVKSRQNSRRKTKIGINSWVQSRLG